MNNKDEKEIKKEEKEIKKKTKKEPKKEVKKEPKEIKKETKKETKKEKKKVKRAFTLIELLAVIIILGVIMLIAIPSVSKYITNSRKKAYVNTAKEFIKGAAVLVNSGDLELYDKEVTYYIPSKCIPLESGGSSPYGGEFSPGYVLVTYDTRTYNFYWMSRDDHGVGIKNPTSDNDLGTNLIVTGLKEGEVVPNVGIDGRSAIMVLNEDTCTTNGVEVTYAETFSSSDGPIIPAEPGENDKVYNLNLNRYYTSFNEAVNAAGSNQSLILVDNVYENDVLTIPATIKNLKIDFKDYTVEYNYQPENPIINNGEIILTSSTNVGTNTPSLELWNPIKNNGKVEVKGNVFLNTENGSFYNYGTLIVSSGIVSGREAYGVNNYGNMTVTGGLVGGYPRAIGNHSNLTITGGKLGAINNASGATCNISGNTQIDSYYLGVENDGTLTADGLKVRVKYPYSVSGVINRGTATLANVDFEIINNSSSGAYGIENSGTLTLNSGIIKAILEDRSGYEVYGIKNSGTLIMKDGEISGTSQRDDYKGSGMYLEGNSNTTILKGTISGTRYGIKANGNYTLTIGTDGAPVSTSSPEIKGIERYGIGIQLGSSGTFNFYDGIAKGMGNTNNSISGTAATTRYQSGYTLHREYTNSLAMAYLVAQ